MGKPIQKVLSLSKKDYYITHLSLINVILPVKMTNREIEIIARAMIFEGELAGDRFGATARKILKNDLDLSDGGLGNFIKSLQIKGILKTSASGLQIHPILFNSPTEQLYNIKLINKEAS